MSAEAVQVPQTSVKEKLWDALCPIIAVAFPITMFALGILATALVEVPSL